MSEAFAKVLVVLQRGEGPDTALRPYLLTALRRLHIDRVRSLARTRPTDDIAAYDAGEEFHDTAVAGFESGAAARAFASLPERWQLVLWHLEVEGQKPADIAPLLGISANSVSALAYRAREGLRQAFVSMHAQDADDERCATTRAQLGAFIRNDVSKRDGAAVEAHLRDCRECAAIYLELVEVNSGLRALIAPIFLGGAAAAYLGGGVAGGVAGGVGSAAAPACWPGSAASSARAGAGRWPAPPLRASSWPAWSRVCTAAGTTGRSRPPSGRLPPTRWPLPSRRRTGRSRRSRLPRPGRPTRRPATPRPRTRSRNRNRPTHSHGAPRRAA